MNFITESTLRQRYKTDPFTSIKLPKDTRLTPEAYQFLVDRRIEIQYLASECQADKSQKPEMGKKPLETGDYGDYTELTLFLLELEADLFEVCCEASRHMHKEVEQTIVSLAEFLSAVRNTLEFSDSAVLEKWLSNHWNKGVVEASEISVFKYPFNANYSYWIGKLNKVKVYFLRLEQLLRVQEALPSVTIEGIRVCICQLDALMQELARR